MAQESGVTARVPLVAVGEFKAHGVTTAEAATLTEVLSNELISTKKFRVMDRTQVQSILAEQAFQQSGACSEDACLVEMGQVLGIEQMIAGSIGKVGTAYSINARIISVATGEIIRNVSHSYTGPIENLLTSEMSVVARKLAGEVLSFPDKKVPKGSKKLLVGGLAAGGLLLGVAGVYFLLPRDNAGETADLEVRWAP